MKVPKGIVISKDKIHFYKAVSNDYDPTSSNLQSLQNSKRTLVHVHTNPVSERGQDDSQ